MNNANKMKALLIVWMTAAAVVSSWAQQPGTRVVRITGTRFSYPLIQACIDSFNLQYPDIQVVIEQRGSVDPAQYDIMVEGEIETDTKTGDAGGHLRIARFPVLPIANAQSSFARYYGNAGLGRDVITAIYFHNPFVERKRVVKMKASYVVYTRLQQAPAAQVFARHYGFKQADLSGRMVAGSDEHQVKAVLRDTAAVSYAPLSLVYNLHNRQVRDGLTVLPIDIDDNGRLSDDERIYNFADDVIRYIEQAAPNITAAIPTGTLVLQVHNGSASPDTVVFLRWLLDHADNSLHHFGFLVSPTLRRERDLFLNSINSPNK